MKKTKVVHHQKAYYALRSEPGIVRFVEGEGKKTLEACGGESAGYAMSSTQGRRNPFGRWRVGVYTREYKAIRDNAKNNTLLRALGT
jgi:hypothetical protein